MTGNLRAYGRVPFQVAVIHGGPGAAGEMAPVARRLAQTCGVLEPLQTATSLEGQIEELREILFNHAALPAVLIGFSWGAWLGVLVASRYPELVKKLVLVSSGPFAESYVAQLHATRLGRLSEREKADLNAIIGALENPAIEGCDALLARLGSLASKADSYAPAGDAEPSSMIRLNGDLYRQVWNDAAEMRRTGELLRSAQQVGCPVVAIHGDYDPSPADGVSEPLSAALRNFRMVRLAKCGHTPWIERYAREDFYRVLLAEVG